MTEIMRKTLAMMVCIVMLAAASLGARAKDALPLSADPALEARVMAVAEELRCLVCQNETIAASQADLAVDLRKQIRIKLQQGQTEAQILDFMVARYGEFVRYRPALNAGTVLLWVGPFGLLVVAGAVLTTAATHALRRPGAALPPLNEAETQRLNALLGEADAAGASRP